MSPLPRPRTPRTPRTIFSLGLSAAASAAEAGRAARKVRRSRLMVATPGRRACAECIRPTGPLQWAEAKRYDGRNEGGVIMPLYVYQVIEADGSDGEVFEVLQSMSEPALTHHPESGLPVKQLIAAPNVGRKGGVVSGSSAN